ncbi:MAG: hypothetical protein AAF550_01235, partial [Myxococcota bacterium]
MQGVLKSAGAKQIPGGGPGETAAEGDAGVSNGGVVQWLQDHWLTIALVVLAIVLTAACAYFAWRWWKSRRKKKPKPKKNPFGRFVLVQAYRRYLKELPEEAVRELRRTP